MAQVLGGDASVCIILSYSRFLYINTYPSIYIYSAIYRRVIYFCVISKLKKDSLLLPHNNIVTIQTHVYIKDIYERVVYTLYTLYYVLRALCRMIRRWIARANTKTFEENETEKGRERAMRIRSIRVYKLKYVQYMKRLSADITFIDTSSVLCAQMFMINNLLIRLQIEWTTTTRCFTIFIYTYMLAYLKIYYRMCGEHSLHKENINKECIVYTKDLTLHLRTTYMYIGTG